MVLRLDADEIRAAVAAYVRQKGFDDVQGSRVVLGATARVNSCYESESDPQADTYAEIAID